MLSKHKLARFCEIRNASPHNTNLQFELDARAAGFEVRHLGSAERLNDGSGYQWITNWGTLTERHGRMAFEPATAINPFG